MPAQIFLFIKGWSYNDHDDGNDIAGDNEEEEKEDNGNGADGDGSNDKVMI